MYKETGEKGVDEKGEWYMIKYSYNKPCNCHPETCVCGGIRHVNYSEKRYLNEKHACVNCKNCDLYENENSIPSDTYFCKITSDFINDIEQGFCHKFDKE